MQKMYDMHTHTTLSDGGFCPAELIRRVEVKGYEAFAITDHVDMATVDSIVPKLVVAAETENRLGRMTVVPGAELTHVRPQHIAEVANKARQLGAQLILCHGETLAEPVMEGTNRAAIEAGVDILAHPGLITEEDVKLAAAKNIALEVTAKNGHSYTNGHVAKLAREYGVRMTYGSDGHVPGQYKDRQEATKILMGAGLSVEEVDKIFEECRRILLAKNTTNDAKFDSM
jgi:histidinol phosphatase-like PHP family hydrolase